MRFVFLTCLFVIWSASVAQTQVRESRLPVPDEAAQTKSKETIRQIYKDQFTKATKNEQKLDLATNMLTDALATTDAPADRYTLLRIARDMASQIGSVEISQQATDAIIKDFAVADKEVRLETLEKLAAAPGITTYKKICDY